MATYDNADQIYKTIGGVFNYLGTMPEIVKKFRENEVSIRFIYSDPDAEIYVDTMKEPIMVVCGKCDLPAKITMSMKSHIAHLFWMNKINLAMALMRGQMKAKGPIPIIMKLLPLIRPAYDKYPDLLEEHGLGHLKEVIK
jgi:hypothetical protein